jgi:hypothetical protein
MTACEAKKERVKNITNIPQSQGKKGKKTNKRCEMIHREVIRDGKYCHLSVKKGMLLFI